MRAPFERRGLCSVPRSALAQPPGAVGQAAPLTGGPRWRPPLGIGASFPRHWCLRGAPGTIDFSAILTKVRAANPDVLGVATLVFEDGVAITRHAITRQMKALNVNPRMYGLTIGVDTLKFYEVLQRDAEFVYGATPWVPGLVELRAGGLIPIAPQYPGARELVESYRKEFPGADLSYHSAAGYGGCQILVEAIGRAGSLDSGKLRDAI